MFVYNCEKKLFDLELIYCKIVEVLTLCEKP